MMLLVAGLAGWFYLLVQCGLGYDCLFVLFSLI